MMCRRFASLRSLDLSGIAKLQDAHLQGLSRLQLNSVSLAGCEQITGAGLHHIALVPELLALDLTGCCKVRISHQWTQCHRWWSPVLSAQSSCNTTCLFRGRILRGVTATTMSKLHHDALPVQLTVINNICSVSYSEPACMQCAIITCALR